MWFLAQLFRTFPKLELLSIATIPQSPPPAPDVLAAPPKDSAIWQSLDNDSVSMFTPELVPSCFKRSRL